MQRGRRGVNRLQIVVLALAAPVHTVRTVDLEYLDTGIGQVPGEPGTVAAGPLDTDPVHVTEHADPADQRPVAGARGGKAVCGQHAASGVDHRGDVQLLVGPRR